MSELELSACVIDQLSFNNQFTQPRGQARWLGPGLTWLRMVGVLSLAAMSAIQRQPICCRNRLGPDNWSGPFYAQLKH